LAILNHESNEHLDLLAQAEEWKSQYTQEQQLEKIWSLIKLQLEKVNFMTDEQLVF
jgi:hypothetical protein